MIVGAGTSAAGAFTASDELLGLCDDALAHQLSAVSPDGLLPPAALFVQSQGRRSLLRMPEGTDLDWARETVAELDEQDAWALVSAGRVDGRPALLLWAGDGDLETTTQFAQPYRPGPRGAQPDGPVELLSQDLSWRRRTRFFNYEHGYGLHVLLPPGAHVDLDAAIPVVHTALGGAHLDTHMVLRQRARLLVTVDEDGGHEWSFTVGLQAGEMWSRLGPKLVEVARDNGLPAPDGVETGNAVFTIRTDPDPDTFYLNHSIYLQDAFEVAFKAFGFPRNATGL